MRKLSLFLILCTSFLLFNFTDSSDNYWKIINQEQIGDITSILKIRNRPNLTTKDWIRIELENRTDKAIPIEHATYTIDCKVFDKKGGKLVNQGRIAGRNASELFDHILDSPMPMSDLLPGTSVSSKHPSIIGAVLLSMPDKNAVYVEANLNLTIQFTGSESFKFEWSNIPFDFEWTKPEPLEISQLYQHLNVLLSNPDNAALHHYELLTLLSLPEIASGIEVSILLNALKIRSGKADGRHAILYHLNDHYNENQELRDYYLNLLKSEAPKVINELILLYDVWDDRFMEPLIDLYKKADTGTMHRIMNLFHMHKKAWKNEEGISAILSDLLLYKYEDLIYTAPQNLSDHQLLQTALIIDMLGKTGNKDIIPIICPFINEKMRIRDSGLVLDTESFELPRPYRVCDNALEAILRLHEKDLIKVYKNQKYAPPYEHGEGDIIITRIRDKMITDLKQKGKVCR